MQKSSAAEKLSFMLNNILSNHIMCVFLYFYRSFDKNELEKKVTLLVIWLINVNREKDNPASESTSTKNKILKF